MTTRTTEKTVTFNRRFELARGDYSIPPGDYLVATDEEMIEGVSRPAWRRIATMIHLRKGGTTQVLTIDPQELENLLLEDIDPSSHD